MYNNHGRIKMSQRNFLFSIVGRIVGMITSFAGRVVFVKALSTEYLGLGGFFGNVFSVVSLCELGVGAAVAQSLYKPLADNDEYRVCAIVNYYTKFCRTISFVTAIVSTAAIPLLPHIVKACIDMKVIIAAYMLFVLHSSISYLLLPKCTLVVCDQRMYVVTFVRSVFSVVALVLQSVMLVLTGNYILYLVCRILVLTVEDLVINRYADKNYPCLALKMSVTSEYKKNLYSNVKALMWHKVGGVLSRSTDSILLTYFVGLSGMGKYSNYALVIGTVGAFFDVAINAASASVGNLGACDRGKKSENVMRKMYFINFWLLTVGTSVIVCTLNPFISLWLGEQMLFTNAEMLVIVSSFYFSCIRDPVQIFVSTFGLFKESRHIPLLRAAANLVLSVIFVVRMGAIGVFLGTALSTVLVPLCMEVKVLYKHGFKLPAGEFYREMLCYIAVSVTCAALCFGTTLRFPVSPVGVVARAVTALCISNVILLMLESEKGYFSDAVEILRRSVLGRHKSKL